MTASPLSNESAVPLSYSSGEAGIGSTPFAFACPLCRARLTSVAPDLLRCPADGVTYPCAVGIWRLLPPARLADDGQFIQEYETVREAEGRGGDDPAYYRALPWRDRSGRHAAAWAIRTQSFDRFLSAVVEPLAKTQHAPLCLLDLGTGNGWLAYQLSRRGHHVAAVDPLGSVNFLTVDRIDALAATLGLRWQIERPRYGWRWAVRPWLARLRGRRQPAQFLLLLGRKVEG